MASNPTLFKVAIDNFPLQFLPDCGSDGTVINSETFANYQHFINASVNLSKSQTTFTAANDTPINCHGYFHANLSTESGNTCNAKIYVADISPSDPPLLGEDHLLTLGLITYHPQGSSIRKVAKEPITADNPISKINIELTDPSEIEMFESLHKKYKGVFSGMGLLKNYEVNFELSSPIEFFHRPALVPVHLRSKATERLHEYIDLGLFEWVPEGMPVPYSSSLMVIEEKKDKVRLVGDYRFLNQHIAKTSTTPAPTLDSFLDKLQGSRYFISTDMKHGYWQLGLSESSRNLCCLSTHLGNVRPTRVPMGVKISGEIFDARVAAVLSHCEHTCHNRDDILIGCATIKELFEEWEKVLIAYQNAGLTLSPQKTKVGLTSVEWFGFLFTSKGAQPSPKKLRHFAQHLDLCVRMA